MFDEMYEETRLPVGPDAPLVVEPVVASHMENVYDFYKPSGIFPQVGIFTSVPGIIARDPQKNVHTCMLFGGNVKMCL